MSSYAVLWFLPSGPVLGRATDGSGNRAPCSMQRPFNGSAWRISPKSLLIWLHNLSLNQQCSKESLSCGPVNIPNIQEFHVISFFRSKDSSYSFMYYPVNYPYRKAKTNSQNLKHKSAVKYCSPESLKLSFWVCVCNKVLLKYKGNRESFWHRHQKGAERVPTC